jgi:ABC-type Fe3+ transport system substrate-binding protein
MGTRIIFVTKAVVAAATVVFGVSAASMTYAQTAKMTPALKELAAAADKEGQVIIKYSSNFFDGGRGIKIYTDNVNKAYGTNIKVVWAPGGSMPEIGNEIAVSLRNNLPAPTDVYFGFSRNMAAFLKFDLFQKVPWKSYDPERLTDRIVEKDTYVKAYSATLGFSYNTDLVKSKPERVTDFLKPEFKGKIATTAFGAGFDQLAAKEAWGPDKTIEFAKQFAKQVGGFMLCPEAERLASGEFLAFVTDCGGGSMVKASLNGAPIRRVVTPDVPLISYFYNAIPKNAPNPNAAKLFVVYLHSPQGMRDMYDLHQNDLHLYPESQQRDGIEAVEKKFGIKFIDADIAWQETNERGNAAQREVVKIFQSGGK